MELLLTLGHNSSAILMDSARGLILAGYEEERISGKKSDSAFPKGCIEKLSGNYHIPNDVVIYVSHWFTNGQLPDGDNKYWHGTYLRVKFPGCKIKSVNKDFSHHDAHAWSALMFHKSQGIPVSEKCGVLVVDGFGNFGETCSAYSVDGTSHELDLKFRSFGFASSVGLFFQYATAFLGLKENQDEYKLLGYEPHIAKFGLNAKALALESDKFAAMLWDAMTDDSAVLGSDHDPVLTVEALPNLRFDYSRMWSQCMDLLEIDKSDVEKTRCAVAYITQRATEDVVKLLAGQFGFNQLIVSGGVFMNVKLNWALARLFDGNFTVMPLCGDQGAALGLWYYDFRMAVDFRGLAFGIRQDPGPTLMDVPGAYVTKGIDAAQLVADLLVSDNIVNVVDRKYMEFGARALGHTSTLALPYKSNVEYINDCNDRSTVMPMAGVVRECDLDYYHLAGITGRIAHNMKFMICTSDFNHILDCDVNGASHIDINRACKTGRTQVVSEGDFLWHVLNEMAVRGTAHPMIINTSFNPHGRPIPYTPEQLVFAHKFMKVTDSQERIFTVAY